MKSNIKRLMEFVKSVGGEVFFGECDPTATGYTVFDKPFVKAALYDKDEEISIQAIMCEGDILCLVGEDAEGNIIDSLDINDIYDEGIEDIIDTIGEEKVCLSEDWEYIHEVENVASIKTFKTNADLFIGDDFFVIDWDGMTFSTEEEYQEWLDEAIEPARDCKNRDEIRKSLEIVTDYLRP